MHGIPIIRFWESDIRKNPKKVMDALKEELNIQNRKNLLSLLSYYMMIEIFYFLRRKKEWLIDKLPMV